MGYNYKITAEQIKIIHTAKSKLGLDDELYRETLHERFRVSSSKSLTYQQADSLINLFRAKGFKKETKPKKATVTQGGKTVKIISQAQRELIEVLTSNIVWRIENGYQAWLEKRMHIKKVLTARDAFKVIEGLKGMLGIKTTIINMKALPFPYTPEPQAFINPKTGEVTELIWMFDIAEKRLVCFNVNGDTKWLTTK